MVQDRAGDQVRKVADEERVGDDTVAHRIAVDVDEIRDLREREERDAERQDDRLHAHVRAEERVHVRHQEARILEIAEEGEVGGDRGTQQAEGALALLAAAPGDGLAREVIERDRGHEQRDVAPAPPAVEEQRSGDEPRDRETRAIPREDERPRERDREKQEQERVGIEEHARASARGVPAHPPEYLCRPRACQSAARRCRTNQKQNARAIGAGVFRRSVAVALRPSGLRALVQDESRRLDASGVRASRRRRANHSSDRAPIPSSTLVPGSGTCVQPIDARRGRVVLESLLCRRNARWVEQADQTRRLGLVHPSPTHRTCSPQT